MRQGEGLGMRRRKPGNEAGGGAGNEVGMRQGEGLGMRWGRPGNEANLIQGSSTVMTACHATPTHQRAGEQSETAPASRG